MYSMIKQVFANALPFVTHSSITLDEVGPGTARATLPDKPELKNHLGTQHAAALFAVGETASGAAMASLVGERLMSLRPVAANADISYRKLARGKIAAHAQTSKTAEKVTAELDADGKSRFEVSVSLRDDEDNEVATMRVEWHLSQRQ